MSTRDNKIYIWIAKFWVNMCFKSYFSNIIIKTHIDRNSVQWWGAFAMHFRCTSIMLRCTLRKRGWWRKKKSKRRRGSGSSEWGGWRDEEDDRWEGRGRGRWSELRRWVQLKQKEREERRKSKTMPRAFWSKKRQKNSFLKKLKIRHVFKIFPTWEIVCQISQIKSI